MEINHFIIKTRKKMISNDKIHINDFIFKKKEINFANKTFFFFEGEKTIADNRVSVIKKIISS